MPNLNERLARLETDGCLLHADDPGLYFHPAVCIVAGRKLRWVNCFAEDQHHAHLMPFYRSELIYDRDVAFYNRKGRIIFYVAPFDEWFIPNIDAYRAEHQRWVDSMRDESFRGYFERFAESELASLIRGTFD